MNRKKILVYTCCTACASHVFKELSQNGLDPIAYFDAPQLKDRSEYEMRLSDLSKYCQSSSIKLIAGDYRPEVFESLLRPYRDHASIKYIADKGRYQRKRCEFCNISSIENTIRVCRKNHLRYFTTTDLCSPYKNHELIVGLCNQYALEYNTVFYYQDFRKGYWSGRNYARTRGIYTPAFCGCLDSLTEGRLE